MYVVSQEALSLPNNLRIELVEKLVASLDIDRDENVSTTWLNIAQKRQAEIANGEIIPIDDEEVVSRVRQTESCI